MKTAGVVLDFYDDVSGALLKQAFPTADSLHEHIKTAHILSPEEREVLRDEAYALILMNEGKPLRKFACVDPGNTLLSVLYFEQNAHLLPEEAMKTAAANLAHFCEEFGMDPTNLIKMAARSGKSRTRDSQKQPLVGDEADWAGRTNLVSIQGGADSGRVIPTANQMKTAGVKEANGDMLQYFQDHPEKLKEKKERDAKKEKKSGVQGGGVTLTDDKKDNGPEKKNPAALHHKKVEDKNTFATGQGKGDLEVNYKETVWPKVANIVDVSGKSAPTIFVKQASERTALAGRYSLDSYADVQKAVEFFEQNWPEMVPEDRHEYSVKTAARAEELGIVVPELMARYGSTGYAPDVDAHLANRLAVCEPEYQEVYDALREKRASVEPTRFAELLAEADEVSGLRWVWGGEVSDPYLSTFGGETEKEASAAWDWQGSLGDRVTADQLHKLARNGRGIMKKMFSHTIVDAFQKDPIAIFESMPNEQKVLMARMANDGEFDSMPIN